jgi:hypothetical protein
MLSHNGNIRRNERRAIRHGGTEPCPVCLASHARGCVHQAAALAASRRAQAATVGPKPPTGSYMTDPPVPLKPSPRVAALLAAREAAAL